MFLCVTILILLFMLMVTCYSEVPSDVFDDVVSTLLLLCCYLMLLMFSVKVVSVFKVLQQWFCSQAGLLGVLLCYLGSRKVEGEVSVYRSALFV